ncbi:MAG: HD domain-containing protein [Spirochaetaceae bacterium]|jgi:putative nucleotidyltransferase with HDIG domain|nr:HD domain-containing protein [Spirochaetaceae bacterium]
MNNVPVDPLLKEIAACFAKQGKQAYLVGGAVRDLLLGKKPADWDLASDAKPEDLMSMFRHVIPTGIKHGTVTVLYKGISVEVTAFRSESGYTDGRRPDRVEYVSSIEEDLSRRDFTMNALAAELPSGRLVDPFGGAADIKNKTIRCVGRPADRFSEDGLRPMRALRFASQLGFSVEAETLDAVPGALGITAKISPERIRDEFEKIVASGRPSAALLLMEKTGLLELLFPDLAQCRPVEQKGCHRYDVLGHSILACDFAARKGYSQTVRLAALLHDLGKKATLRIDPDGTRTFYQHEKESVRLARNILRQYRYPNAAIDAVAHLIGEHMFHYTEDWGDAAVRRFIVRAGEENLGELFRLRFADAFGTAGLDPAADFLLPLINRVEDVLSQNRAFSLKDLAVSGKDLIASGIKPGKHMGIILNELLEAVLDDPALNTREKLLEIAGNINKRY